MSSLKVMTSVKSLKAMTSVKTKSPCKCWLTRAFSFLVIRLGFEPRTPTLKVLCSTSWASESDLCLLLKSECKDSMSDEKSKILRVYFWHFLHNNSYISENELNKNCILLATIVEKWPDLCRKPFIRAKNRLSYVQFSLPLSQRQTKFNLWQTIKRSFFQWWA